VHCILTRLGDKVMLQTLSIESKHPQSLSGSVSDVSGVQCFTVMHRSETLHMSAACTCRGVMYLLPQLATQPVGDANTSL
jgi:hypothetical protein